MDRGHILFDDEGTLNRFECGGGFLFRLCHVEHFDIVEIFQFPLIALRPISNNHLLCNIFHFCDLPNFWAKAFVEHKMRLYAETKWASR